MSEQYLPREVQEAADNILKKTGTPVTVTRKGSSWTVEHGNDRVQLVCRFVRNSRGTFTYSSSLSVDGKPRELVHNPEAYARLLENPDEEHPNRRPDVVLAPVHPIAEGTELPAIVATTEEAARNGKRVTSVLVGHPSMIHRNDKGYGLGELTPEEAAVDTDSFVVDLVNEKGDRLHLYFRPNPKAPGMYYPSSMAAVDTQGRDRMLEVGDNIDRALAALFGLTLPSHVEPDTGSARPNGTSKGAVSNSVQVRKSTVFRI